MSKSVVSVKCHPLRIKLLLLLLLLAVVVVLFLLPLYAIVEVVAFACFSKNTHRFVFYPPLGSLRSSHKTPDKSSAPPGDPVAESSRPTSARSRSSRRSSHNSLTAESDNDNKEEEQEKEAEDKESNRDAKRTSSSSSSSSSTSSSSDSDDEKGNVGTEGPDPVVSEDEPPAVKFHVSNGNEACLLTKGSHGLLICTFAQWNLNSVTL